MIEVKQAKSINLSWSLVSQQNTFDSLRTVINVRISQLNPQRSSALANGTSHAVRKDRQGEKIDRAQNRVRHPLLPFPSPA